jgi:hypothetical protein
MRIWIVAGLAALLLGTAGAAQAQERPEISAEDADMLEALAEVDAAFGRVAATMGVPAPQLGPVMEALVTTLVADSADGANDYSLVWGFEIFSERIDDGPGQPILTHAGQCTPPLAGMSVVGFRRLSQNGAIGHRCVFIGADPTQPDAHGMVAETVLQNGERQLRSRIGLGAASETTGRAADVLDARVSTLEAAADEVDRLLAEMLLGTADSVAVAEAEPLATSATRDGLTDDDFAVIDDMARQLDESLATLAEQLGVESVSVRPMMAVMLGDVFKDLPDEGDYGFTVDFEMYGVTDTGGLDAGAADEDERKRRPVFADAPACSAANQNLPVIRFERVRIGGLSGHRCIVSGQSPEAEDAWLYMAWFVLEGPDAYLEVSTGAAAASEADGYALTSRIGLERLDALNAMAGQIETLALETFLDAGEQADPDAE